MTFLKKPDDLVDLGPIEILQKITLANSTKTEVEAKTQVTVHLKNGASWTGAPVRAETVCILLELKPNKTSLFLLPSEIAAVEIQNLEAVLSFIEKPWLRDIKNTILSKLQLNREIEATWKDILPIKIDLKYDSFPTQDDTPSAILLWVEYLKAELIKIKSSDFGRNALGSINNIEIHFGSTDTSIRDGKAILFDVTLTQDSFQKDRIAAQLNSCL